MKDRLLVGALRAAYRDLLARDRHPIAALFVEVPADEVDINVHPAKTEVRFRDPAAVRGLIVGGLAPRSTRPATAAPRASSLPQPAAWQVEPVAHSIVIPAKAGIPVCRCFAAFDQRAGPSLRWGDGEGRDFAPAARAEPATAPVPAYPLGVARGQVAATYIVAEAEDGLVIVDQHAAHERLVLERMRKAVERRGRSRARRC